MNVLVNTSARFSVTPDGVFWSTSENLAYRYWTRFLEVFDEVIVLARACPASEPPAFAKPVSGRGVKIVSLPNYVGIGQFARQCFQVRNVVRESLAEADAVYLSLPCIIGDLVWRALPSDRPFGVGVCGDPYDVFAPGCSAHPLRPFIRYWLTRRLRRACRKAQACTYVTKHRLQSRYPCAIGVFSTYYSSIDLASEAVMETAKIPRRSGPFHIINIGTFDSWYKGPDTLLQAFVFCVQHGLDLNLTLIGSGRFLGEAQKMAENLGVAAHVRFLGQIASSHAVRTELDNADLFVLPSRTEGLPKALIEAMARGLPSIATTVGGIPELLSNENLVPPNDPRMLGMRIVEVLRDPERRAAMSAQNIAKAREYLSPVLRQRRIALYRVMEAKTAGWLKTRRTGSMDRRMLVSE